MGTTELTALVKWGDGTSSMVTSSDVVALGNGDFALLSDHTCAAQGTDTLSVQVGDAGAASVAGKLTVSVS